MKIKNISISLLLMAGSLALGGCNEDFAQPPVNIPAQDGSIGDGTWENPMQAWQAALGTTVGDRTSNWVTGYIVGWIDTSVSNTMSQASAQFSLPCNVDTNMLLAQYPYDEEEWEKMGYTWNDCVSVQLPSGTVRTSLNLKDNPGNFNQQVTLKGTTGSKYCGHYGVRSVADFNWGDQGKYEEPITPVGSSYYCNFEASADINYYIERGWKNVMVKGGLSGWYVKENGGTKFATCSAYLGTSVGGPYENWLISPGIDIDQADEKTLSFSTQAGYESTGSSLEVYVLKGSNPQYGEPVKLECVIAQVPASGFSAWTPSGTIDLSGFSGKIYIGFRYFAEAGGQGYSSEYHIDDFNLGGAEVPADPNAPDVPALETLTYGKVNSISSGKRYALVHGNAVVVPIQESYSYGYLLTEAVQIANNALTTSNLNSFLIEKEGEGYTIRDYYGRYLYMDSSHTSFQVSLTKPTFGLIWKVSESNGVFCFTNVDRNRCIDWAEQYSNFSTVEADAYSGNGPMLFEEGK